MIKICLIGTGNMGQCYANAIRSEKGIKIEKVIGRKIKKLEAFAKTNFIKHYQTNFLNLNKIDAFIIAVSEEQFIKVITKLRILNKPFLCEKPVGINFKQSLLINSLIRKNSKFFVALNRRFFNSVITLKEMIKKNKKPIKIIVNDQQDLLHAKKIKKKQIVINNYMYANSIHLIDLARYLINSTSNDFKIFNIKKKKNFIKSKIIFSNKDQIDYNCKWNVPGRWSIKLNLPNRKFLLKPIEDLLIKKKLKYCKYSKLIDNDDFNFKPGIKKIINSFKLILKSKKPKYNLITMDDYLKSVFLVKCIYEKKN